MDDTGPPGTIYIATYTTRDTDLKWLGILTNHDILAKNCYLQGKTFPLPPSQWTNMEGNKDNTGAKHIISINGNPVHGG